MLRSLLGLTFLGAVAFQSSVTASTITQDAFQLTESTPIIVSMNRLSRRSKHVYIEGIISNNSSNQSFFVDSASKLILDITGAEFDSSNDVTIVSSAINQSDTALSITSFTSTTKPKKRQIVTKIDWPVITERTTHRKFVIKAKIDKVDDLGLSITGATSRMVAPLITLPFSDVTSKTAVPFGQLSTSFKPLNELKSTNRLATVDFKISKISSPVPIPTSSLSTFYDALGNAKIIGSSGSGSICTLNGSPIDVYVNTGENGSISFQTSDFFGHKDDRVLIKCNPDHVKIDYGTSIKPADHLWVIDNFIADKFYQVDAADFHLKKSGFSKVVIAIFAGPIAVAVIAAIAFVMAKAKVGPFKTKEYVDPAEQEQRPINTDSSTYQSLE